MAKTKQQKEVLVDTLVQNLNDSKSVVFANFQGLKVSESDNLRKQCRESNIRYIASKKTFVKYALKKIGIDLDTKGFEGGVAVVFGIEDEVAPAKIVADFAKKHDLVTIFGGVLEGKFINANKVNELAKLPSRQQLLGQLVGTINAPISGFVNVLAGNLRGLVNVMNAIKDTKTA